jgi:hypothetical protein
VKEFLGRYLAVVVGIEMSEQKVGNGQVSGVFFPNPPKAW